ncbi:neurexin [Plakobranchus ocellatus]|uniref:Neurexin n=1 Tax=Plakobranchus ocellatus TaxID=259542 RepID=A0AAV4CUW5_9GAST|nr:neurexin [Plakobranchus ocellatus]
MSHITKILLKIIMLRIRNKIKPEIAEEQCGFVEDKGGGIGEKEKEEEKKFEEILKDAHESKNIIKMLTCISQEHFSCETRVCYSNSQLSSSKPQTENEEDDDAAAAAAAAADDDDDDHDHDDHDINDDDDGDVDDYDNDDDDGEKSPSDATFLGAQYISYNLSSKGDVMVSNKDIIMLDFRTKQENCLLFYIGNSKDFITIGLHGGVMFGNINLGSGVTKIPVPRTRFDDNRWHQLYIKRESSQVNIKIDGWYDKYHTMTGKYIRLSSNTLYVAGSPNTEHLAGSEVSTNFKGCMRKVRYEADNVRLDLTGLAREQHSLLTVVGDVLFDKCQELAESQPVTFATPDSYIVVPTWDRSRTKGSLAFQFRTVEQGGLLMYSNGNRDSHDFFALEIMDGQLYLVLDMGSGIKKIKATRASISDGNPHNVFFEFYDNKGSISVDDRKAQFSTSRLSDRFDLHGELYVGGVAPSINVSSLPRDLWTAMFELFYVGCLQDLVVNGNMVDLVAAAKLQSKSNVVGYCKQVRAIQCGLVRAASNVGYFKQVRATVWTCWGS